MKNFLFLVFFLALMHTSCTKIESLSDIPHIEYRSFQIYDTVDGLGNFSKGGRLEFYFEDGDGDIGFNPPDDPTRDTSNIIFSVYKKNNGIMEPYTNTGTGSYIAPPARIPYIEKEGQNKILKGTVQLTLLYLDHSAGDTIMYDFYIIDRAANHSNTVSTNEIVVSENGTY
ncbi:MAG TPA: hypothetical protein VHO50_13565 [Bacteroidales bacterium]|nr:hypothetical protein [Bacteroidales bacterium]